MSVPFIKRLHPPMIALIPYCAEEPQPRQPMMDEGTDKPIVVMARTATSVTIHWDPQAGQAEVLVRCPESGTAGRSPLLLLLYNACILHSVRRLST